MANNSFYGSVPLLPAIIFLSLSDNDFDAVEFGNCKVTIDLVQAFIPYNLTALAKQYGIKRTDQPLLRYFVAGIGHIV